MHERSGPNPSRSLIALQWASFGASSRSDQGVRSMADGAGYSCGGSAGIAPASRFTLAALLRIGHLKATHVARSMCDRREYTRDGWRGL